MNYEIGDFVRKQAIIAFLREFEKLPWWKRKLAGILPVKFLHVAFDEIEARKRNEY